MKHSLKTLMSGAAAAALGAAMPALAQAQTGEETARERADVIIVTATAGGAGVRKQDAAFAFSSISSNDIEEINPLSTADVLKAVPGVWVESSGGQNGANIFVRGFPGGGDAEFVTFQLDGSPSFPPPTLSFLENSQLFRLDETVERIEAVRGGPAQIFSNGQPGLTVNLIQRRGGPVASGMAGASITDFGQWRVDGQYGGPIGDNTFFSVGGFYREGESVREAGFNTEKGGQISGNISHEFNDGGELLVYARYLNDRGAWLLPIPVLQDGSSISSAPGFDVGTATFLSEDNRFNTLNDGSAFDAADGRGAELINVGLNYSRNLSDRVRMDLRVSYLDGEANTTGLVPAGLPVSAADFAAGFGAGIGDFTYRAGGQAADPNMDVMEVGAWIVEKDITALTGEFSLTFDLGSHNLTAGVYGADFESQDRWNLGNFLLLEARSNPRVLNMTLDDGRQVTRDGFTRGSFFNVNADYEATDYAFYLSDEWQVNDQLRIDAGIRWHRHIVDGVLENNDFGVDTDGDPDTLYNNDDAVLNGTFSTIRFRDDEFAWTLGFNYAFTQEFGVFARYSRGNSFPQFDQLRDGLDLTQKIDTWEGGIKYSPVWGEVFATLFYNEFDGIANTQIVNNELVQNVGGAETLGFEIEGRIEPVEGLRLSGSATWLDAEYVNFFVANGTIDASGNRVQRQPKWQLRGTAAYTADYGFGPLTVHGTVHWVDDRFSDILNNQPLPSYTKVDAGVYWEPTDRVRLSVVADNLFDGSGLTEGNPRSLTQPGSGMILARPILGRNFTFRVAARF